MMEPIRRVRPSYAGVTATLALVLALGMGGAYAATKIGSKQIAPSAVKSKHIRNGHVRTPDLAEGAVTNAGLADDAVSGAKIVDQAVSGADIADGAVTGAHLADDSVGASELRLTQRTDSVNVANNTTGNVTAECQAGETPIAGGGGFAGVPNGTTLATSEAANGGWYVEGKNSSGGVVTLIVQAFCLGA